MSLSRHSSTEALTSSKRGSEKDSDIEPEKSSIGEISSSTSARPPMGSSSPASMRRWYHSSAPISHSNDWSCKSRRSGTWSGSRIFAKDGRVGAPGSRSTELFAAGVLGGRETAKIASFRTLALPSAGPWFPGGDSWQSHLETTLPARVGAVADGVVRGCACLADEVVVGNCSRAAKPEASVTMNADADRCALRTGDRITQDHADRGLEQGRGSRQSNDSDGAGPAPNPMRRSPGRG